MTDRPGMEVRENGSSGIRDRTQELIETSENIDKETGLPYEVSGTRELIAGFIEEAITGQRSVIFINGDMNNLKQINDTRTLGHDCGNQAIKAMTVNAREILLGIENAESVIVFRPQAGGDEYQALVIFSQNTKVTEETAGEIAKKLRAPLPIEVTDKQKLTQKLQITSSAGVVFRNFTSGETEPFQRLEELELEAERIMYEEKITKLSARIEATVDKGKGLSEEEYSELFANEFEGTRMTRELLRIYTLQLRAKGIQKTNGSAGPRRTTK